MLVKDNRELQYKYAVNCFILTQWMDYLSENLGCHFASAVNLTADLHILDIKNKTERTQKH